MGFWPFPGDLRPHLAHRLVLVSALTVAAAAGPGFAIAAEPSVRILLLERTASVRVTVQGPCRASSLSKSLPPTVLETVRWQEVRPSSKGLQVGRTPFATDRLRLAPMESSMITVNGVKRRGALLILRREDGQLLVTNEVPLEDYLKGVVPREVDARWPTETLKAQAIVARTFTLRQVADRAGHEFDVTPTWPQLSGGLSDERPRATEAVEATRGLVLTTGGQLLLTYYHTVCGGRTEDAEAVWPTVRSPSLRSVECSYCRGAPRFHWLLVVSGETFTTALAPRGVPVGPVAEIQLGPRNRSGRVTTVTVVGADGSTTIVPALHVRAALGPNRWRSTHFTVHRDDGRWIVEGFGWAHGVGLCQWGAARLGQRKWTAPAILEFYYPGAELGQWTPS